MNQPPSGEWQDLARLWQTSVAPVTVAEIEALHQRQRRRLRAATVVELAGASLGVAAALWLGFVSRFLWVGILTVAFAAASVIVVLRARRSQDRQEPSTDLLESLQGSLNYQDWLIVQLRYGRALSLVALFAIVIAASEQLMHVANATRSGLLATAAAGTAVLAALAWNLTLVWNVSKRSARLQEFREKLVADHATTLPLA